MSLFSPWIGILGGPLVWLVFLQLNYMLAPSACLSQNKVMLGIVTVVALFGTVAPAFAAWRAWHHTGATGQTEEGGAIGRSRFMALSGIGLSALFALVVLASAIPIIFLGACD
jgi:hypothetical protein